MGVKQEATRLHESGHNCAQSVFCSCREYTGVDDKIALAVSGGFGGGVRCGEICGALTGAVMAIARVTTTKDNTVCATLEGTQNKHGVYPARTGNFNNLYIGRIVLASSTCPVSTCVTAPVTTECYNLRFKFSSVF